MPRVLEAIRTARPPFEHYATTITRLHPYQGSYFEITQLQRAIVTEIRAGDLLLDLLVVERFLGFARIGFGAVAFLLAAAETRAVLVGGLRLAGAVALFAEAIEIDDFGHGLSPMLNRKQLAAAIALQNENAQGTRQIPRARRVNR